MAEDFQLRFYHRILGFLLILFHYVRIGFLILLYIAIHPFKPLSKYRPATPKCIIDSKHGHHKYIKVNGIKLHYVEKGDAEKPLMLFVHGFPEFWYSWRHQIQEFSNDYWCIAVDMRGYGDSEKPKGLKPYKIPNLVQDIRELILELGREKVTLVSHDWGVAVSMAFIDQYALMIDKFVVMSGAAIDDYIELYWSDLWQFMHGWYVFYFQGPFLPELSIKLNDFDSLSLLKTNNKSISDDDIEAYKYTFGKVGALTPPLNYYRANYNVILAKNPQQTIMPKGLCIMGEFDEFISSKVSERMNKKYGLKVKVLKGSHHFIQQEAPEEVNEIMREFLKE